MIDTTELTARQQRELDYLITYADEEREKLNEPFNLDVIEDSPRRWWNQYRAMYTYLLGKKLKGKNVLVVGYGFGVDALILAKGGANVKALDSSQSVHHRSNLLANLNSFIFTFRRNYLHIYMRQ